MTLARRLISTALVVACSIGVAACGSGGSNGTNAAAAEAAVSQTFIDVSKTTVTLTASQASCLGTGIIGAFGVDRAERYGFLTKDLKPATSLSLHLTPQDAATYADLYLRCADPSTAIKNELIAGIAPKTDAAQARLRACLDKTLTKALMRSALQAAASGDTGNASLTALYTACGRLG